MFVILPKVFGIVPASMLLLNSRCRNDIKFSPKVEQIEVKLLALKTLEEKLIMANQKEYIVVICTAFVKQGISPTRLL